MILILALIAIVFFVIGIALIFKSYSDIPDPEKIVPVEEVVKIKKDLDTSQQEEEKLKQKLDALVVELEKTRGNLDAAQAKGQDTEALKSQVKNYEDRVGELVQSLEYLRTKADQQALEAAEVLTSLQTENENLKNLAQEAERRVDPAVLTQMQAEKKALEDKVQENETRLKALEQEAAAARNQSTEQTAQDEKSLSDLKAQNEQMKQELQEVSTKIKDLEVALAQAREEKDAELKNAQKSVEEFKAQMEALAKEKEENDAQSRHLQEEVERARQQVLTAPAALPGFEKEKALLEKNLEDLKTLNARMLAREKLLQQELTKSRAQAMGLEKVCAEFKTQLDQMRPAQ